MGWFEIVVGVATVIATVIAILHFFRKPQAQTPVTVEVSEKSIATRFLNLFETHGIHRNQIPSFIHGLTIADVQTEQSLLPKFNDELLNYVCELFAVRREWLDGASDEIYETHDFYKHPELCEEFIQRLKAHENAVHHYGVLLVAKDSKSWHESAVIVLSETIELGNGKLIDRYYICNNWSYNYFKSKGYLTACVALLWKNNINIQGRYVS